MWIELSQISTTARLNGCSACGSNVKEVPALSTGSLIEFEGTIEICQRCIVEAAAIYGLVDPSSLPDQSAEIAELRIWAESAYADLTAQQGTIETLSAALAKVAQERDALAEDAAKYRDLADS